MKTTLTTEATHNLSIRLTDEELRTLVFILGCDNTIPVAIKEVYPSKDVQPIKTFLKQLHSQITLG